MITILKALPRPPWLIANQADKTADYMAAAPGDRLSPWNRSEIKNVLKMECRSKCMYCEVDPEDSSYPAVEHIKPKELFPELVLEWTNLGWACNRCNTNKGAYWSDHGELRLINPYEDDPDDHFEHAGPIVLNVIGSERGKNTIRRLKLNRESLFASKIRRMNELDELIQVWHREIDPDLKAVVAEDVLGLLDESAEFCASLRVFASTRGFVSPVA